MKRRETSLHRLHVLSVRLLMLIGEPTFWRQGDKICANNYQVNVKIVGYLNYVKTGLRFVNISVLPEVRIVFCFCVIIMARKQDVETLLF